LVERMCRAVRTDEVSASFSRIESGSYKLEPF
jgi:hypothetical protein